MRKQIITVLLICTVMGCLFGCSKDTANEAIDSKQTSVEQENNKQDSNEKSSGRKHSIEVSDDKEIISKFPKSAKAGDKVTLKTNSFMDAIPQIRINGNDIGEWDANKTKYTFIMPDEDVKITATLKSSGMV